MLSYAVIYRIFLIRNSAVLVAAVVILPIWMPVSFTVLSFYAGTLVNLFILLPVYAVVNIISLLRVLLMHPLTSSVVLRMCIFQVWTPKILYVIGKVVIMAILIAVLPTWARLPMLRCRTVILKERGNLNNKILSKIAVIAIVGIVIWFNLPVDISALFSFGGF